MKNAATMIVLALICAATSASLAVAADSTSPRTRESFNNDWLFFRCGPMPDGSNLREPGGEGWSITASASSQELDKGHAAELAIDGNPETRWCAGSGTLPQWLAFELAEPTPIARAEIAWEFPDLKYDHTVEGSVDGRAWAPLGSTPVRHVRIKITGVGGKKWSSISEVRLIGADGKLVANQRITASGSPSDTDFADTAWRHLDLPHDWGVEGPFRDDLDNNTGKLPWKGIGWYRKHFTLPATDQGRRVFADFDGAMANAQVWINGEPVGGWPYGYQPFRVELTDHLKFGAENVISVRLDTAHWGSRWYPGAGLYRNTWLVKTAPVHVAHWGAYVTTPNVTDERAEVRVVTTIDNQGSKDETVELRIAVLEPSADGTGGRIAYEGAVPGIVTPAGKGNVNEHKLSVARPKRWDLATPNLYTARISLAVGGRVVDVYDQPFGIRTIEFTPRDGFKLNGRRVPVNGTCNHHDLGPLGAAFNTRAMERQIEILKEMGCNALRTSHNPPAPELIELADRMGMLVQCEAFDCWRAGKTANDYATLFDAWHEKDLRAMVRRERNHPSVVMWSIGNEIREQNGPDLAKPLRDIIHDEDPTRPVTAGCNNAKAGVNGFQNAVDLFGLNYHLGDFAKFLAHPGNETKPVHSSESSSCVSSRGEYFFPPERGNASRVNFQVSSYDVDAPGWACAPDDQFAAMDRHPAFFGEFVWTGFDYLGEPTPYNNDVSNLLNFSDPAQRAAMQKELEALGKIRVPSASSYFGIVDLCGFKKDRFFIYQARWRPDLPMVHILPHWNWPERAGQVTPVHVYTSGDEVELFLNGRSLGRKKRGEFEYRLRWDDTVYQPGELKAVAYRRDQKWAEETVKTTGSPAQVRMSADRSRIHADGRDLSYVTVAIADREGLTVPRTHNLMKFELEGPGEIVAVGNGDAASHEPFIAKQRAAFNGLCLVIVRTKSGQAGTITLKAAADGLTPTALELVAE